ncbi:MAG: PKD-like domain-containing protein, partial [bacterium]
CNGIPNTYNITSSSTAPAPSYAWTRAAVPGITNLAGSGAGSAITETLINTTVNPVVVHYLITPTVNSCAGTLFDVSVTVNPTSVITSAATANWCSNVANTYNILSSSTTPTPVFTWTRAVVPGITNLAGSGTGATITETLVNSTADPVVVHYLITPTTNGCDGITKDVSVTVNPTSVITSPASISRCNNVPGTYSITSSSITPTPSYAWTRAVVPGITNAAGAGAGAFITETLVNSTTDPVIAIYVITPTVNACSGTPYNVAVTVNPTAVITSPATGNWANNVLNTYVITSSSTTPAPTYTWTRAAMPGITPATGSGTGAVITETLSNSTTDPIIVHYLIIPSVNGCPGTTYDVAVTVNPTSSITSPASANWCNNTANTYTITSSTTPTPTFTWTRDPVPGISNSAGSGTGAIITETLVNTTTDPVVVFYVIIPWAGGFPGTQYNVAVTVNPTAVVTSVATANWCSNVPNTYNILSSTTPTPAFSWTRALVPGITPATGAGTGSIITETLTNSSTDPVTTDYIITPTINSCVGTPKTVTVTMNPTSVITSPSTANWCNGIPNTYNITSSSTAPSPTYAWTRGTVPGITNLAGAGAGASITETLVNSTTDPIIVHYMITPTVNGCNGTLYDVSVTVNPTAIITSPPTANWCNSQPNTYNISSSTTPTPVFTWSRAAVPGISNAANAGSGASITETLVNTTIDPVVVTYVITPTINNCAGTSISVLVTVNPTAVITSASTANWCNNVSNTYNITSSSTTPPPAYTWTRAAVPGILNTPGSGAGASITETLQNSTTDPVLVTYIITPAVNGCSGTPKNISVTVNPTAVVTSASTVSWCNNVSNTYNILSSSTTPTPVFSWTRAVVPGITNLAGSGTGASITETLINSTTSPVAVIYVITPAVNGCNGTPKNVTVTVNPTPHLTNGPPAPICSGTSFNVALLPDVTGGNFSWTASCLPLGSVTGFTTPQLTNVTAINDVLTNSTATFATVTYHITPHANGCDGAPVDYSVTINPTPHLTNSPPAAICSGTNFNIALLPDVLGGNFTWTASCLPVGSVTGFTTPQVANVTTINDVLTNLTTAPATVTYHITPHANGCNGILTDFTVTVNPTPHLMNAPPSPVCSGNNFSIALLPDVSGGNFTWTASCSPVGSVTGFTTPQLTNVTGINDVLTNITTAPATVTYHITPHANGCAGISTDFTVTVNPTPHLTNSPPPAICSGTTFSVALLPDVLGGNFTWTASCLPAGSVTGFTTPQLINVTDINDLLTNTTTAPATVTYHITPHANGCSGTSTDYTVTVNPTPHLMNAPPAPICSGSTFNVALLPDVSGGNFSWTATCSPAGSVTGFTTPQVGYVTVINDLLTNVTTAPATVTYHITPHANNCAGIPVDFTVTVNPTPHLMNPQPPTICSGTTLSIPLLPDVTGGNFTWNATCLPVGTVTGFTASQVTGTTMITDLLTNTGNVVSTVTYVITPHANGCAGVQANLAVPVNPVPVISCLPTQSICSGTAFAAVALSSTVTGTDYSWSAACPVGSVNPCPIAPGIANPITPVTLLNVTNIQQTVTYTITSAFQGCPGNSTTHAITVNPSPTVTNWPLEQTICSGQTSAAVNLTATVTGTTFTWTASTASPITGFALSGTSQIPAQTLSIPPAFTGFVTYHVIPSFTGGPSCPGAPTDYKINVNPLPVPAITGLNQVCELQPNVTYTTPAIPGHSYNWNITGATAISGANTNTVTVTWGAYTLSPGTLTVTETIDATGCLQTTSVFSVTIFQRPIPTITGPLSACNTSTGNVYSTEAGMNNYTWTIAGGSITSGGGTGSPTATVTWNSAGTQWIQVNYINAMGCPGFPAKTLTITVNPLPNPAITEGPGPNCESLQHTYLAVPDPACSFLWSITPAGRGMITSGQGQNTVTVDWLTSGPATIGMTATNGTTNCLATGSHLLTVHPKPVPIFNVPCFDLITTPGSKKIILRGGTPVVAGQGVYSGNRVSLNGVSGNYEFDPFGASPGNYFITYTFTNNFGCPAATAPVSINVVNNFFSCGGDLTDIRDSKKYKTTMLSGRCWMKENLTYGTSLSSPSGPVQTDNCLPEKYCGPSDVNCTQYGGMYQWDEVMDYASAPGSKGICPPEWHVPTEAEWQSLIDNLMTGIGAPIANALTGSMLRDPIVTGSFMSLLGGLYYNDNDWAFTTGTNTATQYWTSTVLDATHAIARGLNIHTPSVSKYPSSRSNAFSIRCVKD